MNMLKAELINLIIQKKNLKSYLEIGLDKGFNFNQIICDYKVGVDPVLDDNVKYQGQVYKLTSDDFFKQNTTNFDIILVDGLHLYEQTIKDIINSFNFLNNKGFIVVHDCMPNSEQMAGREPTGDSWNGDVYKAIFWFKDYHEHIPYVIINCDWGCTIIRKNGDLGQYSNESIINYSQFDYNSYLKNMHLLNIKTPDYLEEYLSR
jgi:hypothetical protein